MQKAHNTQLKGKKILFATVPADGHFNPLTGLAKYLQEEAGCDVRWFTSAIFKEKLAKLGIPHYPFVHSTDINAMNFEELMPERRAITDAGEKLNFDMIHVFANRGPEYFLDIREIYQAFPFDLMIADNLFTGIPFVSKKMNIPVVAVGIIPLAEQSNDLAPYGLGLYPPKNDEERAQYQEMNKAGREVAFKESIDVFSNILTEQGIAHEPSILLDLLIKQADLVLQIGTSSFEYPRTDIGENIRFIGGLFPYVSPKKAEEKWSDPRIGQYETVILVTQGTVERDTSKIIVPTLEAFRDTNTLVLATTGGNGTAELKAKYNSDNLIIEDYIPFADVMPHVHVYVTNGGYSGTLLGIKHQLPMVTGGLFEGKNEICSRVGYFEYGIDLGTETPDPLSIYNAVKQVLRNGKYKQNVSRLADEMNSIDSKALSAWHISELLAEKKDHSKLNVSQLMNWLSIF